MLTNKKLLDEIIARTNSDNNGFRENLEKHILSYINETSEGAIAGIKQEIQTLNDSVHTEINELSEKINTGHCAIIDEQNAALKKLRRDTEKRINDLAKKTESIGKKLSDSIAGLQKDNAIIMESLQIIFANMLIDEVPGK